jgi:hypothetical protein
MSAPSHDDEIRAAIIRDAISRAGLHKPEEEGLCTPEEGKNRDQAPARKRKKVDETATGGCGAEIVKRADKERPRLNAFPSERAAFGFDEHHTPSELARAEHAASQLGACEAKGAQQGIEDRSACEPSASANTTLPPYLYHFFSAPQCRDHTGGGDFTFASQLETVPAAPQFSQALNDASCRSIAQQAPAQPWAQEDVALFPLEAELVSLRAALALSTQREESSFQMLKALRIQLHKAYRMIALQQSDLFSSDAEMTPFPDSPESAFSTKHW